jgi:putative hemolysin
MIGLELLFFLALTLVNGFFAMSEMALVSARKSRLGPLAEDGDPRAVRAIELNENPNRFLSSVQIGITLVGLLAGAATGASLADHLAGYLIVLAPTLGPLADEIAFAIVIVFMTFVTLIFGELVPKRIAIAHPEPIALAVGGIIATVSKVASPFVSLLSIASNAVLNLLGVRESTGGDVTEDEVMHVLAEGVQAGVLDPEEREMLEGVMRVADRPVRAIMTPRPDLFWVDPNDPPEVVRREIAECPYSLVVVATGSIDEPDGVVYKKDILADALAGREINLRSLVREPVVVPENAPVLKLLERFRNTPVHCAFVVDEYGSLQGLVTLTDIIEGIAGDLADVDSPHGGPVRRDDGSWLLDGDTDIDDLERLVDLPELERGSYHTLGGLMLSVMNRIPNAGDKALIGDFVFEVMDMDGRRIDKVLVSPRPTERVVPDEEVA